MLSYCEYGFKQDFSLIFFHGFLGNKYDFEMVIEHLFPKFYCISIDLFGHGKSLTKDPINFESFAKAFMQFTKIKNLSIFILIGYSMGARIAHYLHENYLRKTSCILIGSHLGLTSKNDIEKRKVWNKDILTKLEDLSMNQFLNFWYSQKLFDLFRKNKLFSEILEKRKNNHKQFLKKAFEGFCLTKQKVLPSDAFTHFLVGQNDRKYLKYYKTIKCPYSILKNSSHVVHLENPQGLAVKIMEIIHERI